MALVAFENVSFRYPDCSHDALSEVSFEVSSGAFVLVIGRTGCGKTTLLRSLKPTLTPQGTRSGRVVFQGQSLDDLPSAQQAARIGFVMQNPDDQIVTDRVAYELAFGLENLGCPREVMTRRVAEIAGYFGIHPWIDRTTATLSGGQKQVLNVASSMVMQPDVLVLDEPTSQLDPIAARDFMSAVSRLNREVGVTIIMATHNLEEVYGLADQVVVLEEGHVVVQGTPRAVAAALFASGNPLAEALPSPTRIFFGVERRRNDVSARTNSSLTLENEQAIPLTVREGRRWLASEVTTHPAAPLQTTDSSVPSEAVAVRLTDVWFRYDRDGEDVLRGTTLFVPVGETFAILGGNGTGKTTLLQVICGLRQPYRGKIELFGKRVGKRGAHDSHAAKVALLPQDPRNLMAKKTVRADLEEMLVDRSLSAAEREAELAWALDQAGATELQHVHPLDLSGGQLQRVALAKVLLSHPRLLLLDEPTQGLDALSKRHLAATLHTLRLQGVSVLMVSHDVEFCAATAQRAALFFDGKVISPGSANSFFAENRLYTTAASRMSRGFMEGAVTVEEVIDRCLF